LHIVRAAGHRQTLLLQVASIGQAFPQPPQFAAFVETSTQAIPQAVSFAAQVSTHWLREQ
jgi:hypothetical protein